MGKTSGRGPARDGKGRFGPGNPGRPHGSRNLMTARVALSLLRHFEANEAEILQDLTRGRYLPVFMRSLDRLIAREDDGKDGAGDEPLTPQERDRAITAARAALDRAEAGQGSLAEVQAALAGRLPQAPSTVNNGESTVEPSILQRRSGWPGAI